MSQAALVDRLYQIGAIQFGEFKLKSGLTSSIYINLRKIISYPDLLRHVASAMWDITKKCQYDLICGVPYTALPIATCFSLDHSVPMIMRRKEKKDYGTKQLIEGVFKPKQTCLILEDVVTSGTSILETTQDVEAADLIVTDVVALIDREQGGRKTLEQKYRLHTILSMSFILDHLKQSNALSTSERAALDQFIMERQAS